MFRTDENKKKNVSRETIAVPDIGRKEFIENIETLALAQNPHFSFHYYNEAGDPPLVDSFLSMDDGLVVTANTGGFIPHLNGVFVGYTICYHVELFSDPLGPTYGAQAFQIYRNGVATECQFMIGCEANDGYGATKVGYFNPYSYQGDYSEGTNHFFFHAGERIALAIYDPALISENFIHDSSEEQIYVVNLFVKYHRPSETSLGGTHYKKYQDEEDSTLDGGIIIVI